MTKLYMLYYSDPVGIRFKLGGGSSSPPLARVYESREKAEQMRDRHFRGALIKEIEFGKYGVRQDDDYEQGWA